MAKVAKWVFPAAGGKDGIVGTIKAVVGILTGNPALFAAGVAQVAGMGKAEAAARQASVTTLQIGEVPREALLGEVCTGGSLIDAFNHGGTYGTDTVTRCIGLADHAVDAIVGFYADDQYYPWTGDGLQAAFSNKLRLTFLNATNTGHAPPAIALANGWAATDRICGMTHIWVSTDLDDKVWSRGHPEFRFVLRGLRVYDPRFDPALGYAGGSPQTWENRASHVFSRNAALLRYAFARGIYAEGHQGEEAHLLVGRGLTAEEAPPARIIAAANLCDEVVGALPRYAASGVVRSTDAFIAVEEMFAGAMAGVIVQREGGVEVEPGQAKAAVVTITDADLVVGEPVRFSRFLPDGSDGRINTVVPSYVEPDQGWKDHAGPVRRSLTDITTDKGPRFLPLPLPMVTAGAQADRNAEIARLISRLERRAEIVLPPDHAQLEEGDWIAWTSARYHAGATVRYRIESWSLDATWRMRLTLREIASSVYGVATPLADESDPPPAPPTVDPLALSGVTATVVLLAGTGSSVPAVRFAWTAVDPAVIAIRAEVRRDGETVASATRTDDVAALEMTVTNGVGPDQALEVRLVPITSLTRPVTGSVWIPLTTGALTAGDLTPIVPGAVAGTPTLATATTIQPDGTQVSRLASDWADATDAIAYVVELEEGGVSRTLPATASELKDLIIRTGPAYRLRVKGESRTRHLSALWSAWSGTVTASGDTAAPGLPTGFAITNLARRVVLEWTSPSDDDYAGIAVVRNTTGTAPTGVTAPTFGATAPLTGTIFPDTNVTASTTYYYWARSVDRTGNVSAWVYMGSGQPAYLSVGGGDVASNDAALVTNYGTAAAITYQSPWATSALPTARLNQLDNSGNFSDLAYVMSRPMNALSGRTANYLTYTSGGATVDSLKPGEAGANVTEGRTAAGIQNQAPTATSSDFSVITGTTRPSPNAGTSGVLTPIGTFSSVVGNSVIKSTSGTNGTEQGGAVGSAQTGSAYIRSSLLSVMAAGWVITLLALDDDATAFALGTMTYRCHYSASGAGSGVVYLYANGAMVGGSGVSVAGLTLASRMTLVYDGSSVSVSIDGVTHRSTPAPAGLTLWPKVVDYHNSAGTAAPSAIVDVQYGAWTENTTSVVSLVPVNANTQVFGNSIYKTASASLWDSGVTSRDSHVGSAFCSARPGTRIPNNFAMFGISDSAAYAGGFADIDYAWYIELSPSGSALKYYEGGVGGAPLVAAGSWSVDDVLAITYDGVNVRYWHNGVVKRTVATTAGRRFYFTTSNYEVGGGLRDIQFGPYAEAARIDGIWNAPRTAQHGAAEVLTASGVAAGFAGQTSWATSALPTARLNQLDNSGNFSDLAYVANKPMSALTGRTANYLTYTSGGATVDSLKPGEAGANITEGRVAAGFAGQGALALKNAVSAGDINTNAVTTAKVLQNSITPAYYAFTSGSVLWSAEATEKTVQTQSSVTVIRGSVRITALLDIISGTMSSSSAYGILKLKRDGVELYSAERYIYASGAASTWKLPSQAFMDYLDTPGAGTFTYTITFTPSEVITGQVGRRSLFAQPLEG